MPAATTAAPTALPPALREQLTAHGQAHLVRWFDGLQDVGASARLLRQLQDLDVAGVVRAFQRAMTPQSPDHVASLEPLSPTAQFDVDTAPEVTEAWRARGMELIRGGKLGILLMAGGQGTRLGSTNPKGMFDIGLPSGKSLYQLQAERIRRLQTLAGGSATIPWYIMTSEGTDVVTRRFFDEHKHFGLRKADVVFFRQGDMPCMTLDGRIMLAAPDTIAMAPDGNGGVYAALEREGVLADMQRRGLQYVHFYGVDNCLVRLGDPVFLGFGDMMRAEACSKVVRKAHPKENVGVFAFRDGRCEVVEYSEIDPALAAQTDAHGQLRFSAGNIANHLFSVAFLSTLHERAREHLVHHVAKKKIPCIDDATGQALNPTVNNGVKLELFVFDVMQFTRKMFVLYVHREDEFAPLKNARGAADSAPEHARAALVGCHRRMLEAAGARVLLGDGKDGADVEISPLVSYAGEGLEALKGQTLRCPVHISDAAALHALASAARAASGPRVA